MNACYTGTPRNLEGDGKINMLYSVKSPFMDGSINQDWKLNVKARLFVMTLRDHYRDRAENSAIASFGQRSSDDWVFEYISAKYLQPIMEAFDDDGSDADLEVVHNLLCDDHQ